MSMGINLRALVQVKQILRHSLTGNHFGTTTADVPKGHFAIYVGERQKRFVIPISYLKNPSFQNLLTKAEEEFGFDHQMGGLTIPCNEDAFINITSHLNG